MEYSPAVDLVVDFLNASSTAFHAVEEAKKLKSAGCQQVSERGRRLGFESQFTRNFESQFTWNHSTIIVAFAIGQNYVAGNGFYILGAHTDSPPGLKLKPTTKAEELSKPAAAADSVENGAPKSSEKIITNANKHHSLLLQVFLTLESVPDTMFAYNEACAS